MPWASSPPGPTSGDIVTGLLKGLATGPARMTKGRIGDGAPPTHQAGGTERLGQNGSCECPQCGTSSLAQAKPRWTGWGKDQNHDVFYYQQLRVLRLHYDSEDRGPGSQRIQTLCLRRPVLTTLFSARTERTMWLGKVTQDMMSSDGPSARERGSAACGSDSQHSQFKGTYETKVVLPLSRRPGACGDTLTSR
jgi:hypothetical protein